MPVRTCTTRSTICPVCERKFSGRELKKVKKLLDLHMQKSHPGTEIANTTNMQFIHQIEGVGAMKLMTDNELKALHSYEYDQDKMKNLIASMSDQELISMYQRLILS